MIHSMFGAVGAGSFMLRFVTVRGLCVLWSGPIAVQVYVVFESEDGALAALTALVGCLFLDRVVVATFCSQDQLDTAIEKNAEMPESMYPNLTSSLVALPSYT